MKNIKNILVIAIIATSFISCDKWLDIKPADRLVEESVFNSEPGFLSAITGLYMDLQSHNSYGAALGGEFLDVLGQQYNIRPTNYDMGEVAQYFYTAEYPKTRLENIWDQAYRNILNTNKIIENVDKSSGILGKKSQGIFKGEALALRAFLHFDMLRLFGPIIQEDPDAASIPYMDHIDVSAEKLLSASEVIEKILIDLTASESLLKEFDPIIEQGPLSVVEEGIDNEGRFRTLRFNYYAVLALKARVYLYAGDKANALKYAKMVIDAPSRAEFFPFVKHTDLLGDVRDADRVFSTEVLFGLYNTSRNTMYTRSYSPEGAGINILLPRTGSIEELFAGDESDYRKDPIWKSSSLVGGELYSMKYAVGETSTLFRNNMMPLIRLSEMYLIAAECEPNSALAYTYLNTLRNNRGLIDINDDLEIRIEKEYKREFYSEGQVFFYYKRNNVTPIKSGVTGANVVMNAAKYVPGLPDSEKRFR